MLLQLSIRNYAIVDQLEIELSQGMTVISGETGAGKSIMLDALGLALGDKADAGSVRQGSDRAEITASFDLPPKSTARLWLKEQDLDQEDSCILRRVITAEGRSRCYINGHSVPITQLRNLRSALVDIHGQHEHQNLLKKEHQRMLLDEYAQALPQLERVKSLYLQLKQLNEQVAQITKRNTEDEARIQLLSYQVEELDQLAVQEGEIESLEQELDSLSHADDILQKGQQFLEIARDGEQGNALSLLQQCLSLVEGLNLSHPKVSQCYELLTSAQIQLDEANHELDRYLESIEQNPEQLRIVEDRLSLIYDVSRKHRIQPDELLALHRSLKQQLDEISNNEEKLEELAEQQLQLSKEYQLAATQLSEVRQAAANNLSSAVDQQLSNLGMPNARFIPQLEKRETPSPQGMDEVVFMIATNLGQPAKPLAKIASGGELSRISLAIQVITAQCSTTPTLVFDEVDVGIGGAIAQVVGQLLHQLGQTTQILCVTHQPQVASQGDQHLFVSKHLTEEQQTSTEISALEAEQRVEEIARMLGGIDRSALSLEHAKEMLAYRPSALH